MDEKIKESMHEGFEREEDIAANRKPSFVDQMINFDIIDKLKDQLGSKKLINPQTGKIAEIEQLRTLGFDDPWIYTNPDKKRHCHWYTMVANRMGYPPPQCQECWKVVSRPRTLKELFLTLEMQYRMVEEDPDCWCKCGIEVRPWTNWNYGAYFYNDSLEQGREKWERVRKWTDKMVSEDVKVILKRSCTEFERRMGDTRTWDKRFKPENNPMVAQWEKMVEHSCHIEEKPQIIQPDYVKKHVFAKWIQFAWDRNDPSLLELNDGRPLLPPLVTYHDDLEKAYKLAKMKEKMKEMDKEEGTDDDKYDE